MDYKLLALGCILLACNAIAEFTEEDYNLLQANDVNLQRLILNRSKAKSAKLPSQESATKMPTPTLGPNPHPKPSPILKLKDKKVITIEEYEVDGKDV